MSVTVSEHMDIWEAFFVVSSDSLTDEDKQTVDVAISSQLESVDDIIEHHFQFSWNVDLVNNLPTTKAKINHLLDGALGNTISDSAFPSWFILTISPWLVTETKQRLIEGWLQDEEDDGIEIDWILRNAGQSPELNLKIFTKMVKTYKKNKSEAKVKQITNLFSQIGQDHLDEACEVLSKATPSVAACLLTRSDVGDDYILAGLKALSKLSKQRNVDVKIDFEMLGKLGPKARLDAMKQLLGLMKKWYHNKKTELPFSSVPTREEVSNFLFPCSLKYNKEVNDVMIRFDEISRQAS